uniref:hypothetical protein n=2 Tax=Gammaproteobacteria TaxID=1236 RepID=UPI0019549137
PHMHYLCGKQIKIGDAVLIESGQTTGTVEAIIVTAEDMNQWQVNEPGILVKTDPFGLVFWPQSDPDPVLLQPTQHG